MVDQIRVLKGGRLIDGNGGVLADGVVVVEGARIKEVGTAATVAPPDGAEVIDMGSCTLMPGLIECHVHLLGMNATSYKSYRVAIFETSPQLQMLYALHHAQMYLEMGFTTVRDHSKSSPRGDMTMESVAIRDAISSGIFQGPRVLAGGRAHITNSHFDLTIPAASARPLGWPGSGPYVLRDQVRVALRAGCDHIKTTASGGGGTDKEEPDVRNMTQEELDAIVDEAHAFHKHVACHCFTPDAQRRAIKAGVDTIEHCVFTDDEAIQMIVDTKTPLVPTLAHRSDKAIETRRGVGAPEYVLQKMKKIQSFTRETFQRYHQAGVKMALGTDTVVDVPMGAAAVELEIYVNYGMTPMEAIQTATKNAAEAIWLGKTTGTLESGKFADVIAVDGNPLSDITVLQPRENIKLVMKEGRVHVDRRPGRNKAVIGDDEWMKWERR